MYICFAFSVLQPKDPLRSSMWGGEVCATHHLSPIWCCVCQHGVTLIQECLNSLLALAYPRFKASGPMSGHSNQKRFRVRVIIEEASKFIEHSGGRCTSGAPVRMLH